MWIAVIVTVAASSRNGINLQFKNLTGTATGPINPHVILTSIVRHSGSSTITDGIIIAYRPASGLNSVPGAIDRSTVVAIRDPSSGSTIIRW